MGNEATETKVEPIFLEQGDIVPLKKPLPKGDINFMERAGIRWNGHTEIIGPSGISKLDQEVLDFKEGKNHIRVVGSAVVYPVLLSRIDPKNPDYFLSDEDNPNPKERAKEMRLFDGGIEIYFKGLPGVEHDNWYLKRNGRIFFASETEKELRHVVLGDSNSTDEHRIRVEAILAGYLTQERNRQNAQENATHRAYQRGASEEREHPGRGFRF